MSRYQGKRVMWMAAWLSVGMAQAGDSITQLLPMSLEELVSLPVVTASRREERREETPAHILVISQEQIRERRYKTLADLFEDLPGIDFQRGTRSSTFNNYVFQGHGGGNRILILLDGVRIDHPAGGKLPVADNFALYHARQVEVLFGPAAALYGADAMGGVVNIITDRAGQHTGGRVDVSFGQFGSRDVSALANVQLGDGIGLAVGAHDQSSHRAPLDRYYPAAYPKVDARTFGKQLVIPAAQREDYVGSIQSQSQYLRLDVGERLTLGFYQNQFRSLTSTGDRPDTALFLSDAFWQTRISTLYAKYRFDLSPSLKAETVVDQSTMEVNPYSQYVNVFTDFTHHGYDYIYARRQGVEQNFTWTVNDQHVVLAGIGGRRVHAIETPDMPAPYDTSRGPDGQAMFYPNTTLPLKGTSADYHSQSAYLQWQARWSPVVSSVLGVRHDYHSGYGSSTNPRLGLVWENQPGSFLKLMYGEAFRAPSPDETLGAFGTFSGVRNASGSYVGEGFRIPNTALRPEKARTLSLTWDWRPRRDVNLLVNAYRSEVSDLIVTTDEIVSTQYIPGAVLSKTSIKANRGRDVYMGVDIMPQWLLHLNDGWQVDLWAGYSYLQGKVQETEGGIEWDQTNIATHKLKLGATFRYRDRLTITPRIQYIGATTTARKNNLVPGERLMADPYTVASLHVGFHRLAGPNLSAYIDLYNLFDRRYYVAHGSASSTMVTMPQQPRTLMFGLGYTF